MQLSQSDMQKTGFSLGPAMGNYALVVIKPSTIRDDMLLTFKFFVACDRIR